MLENKYGVEINFRFEIVYFIFIGYIMVRIV